MVYKLYKLYGYTPKPEFSACRDCGKGEGIWDVLGHYDSVRQIVTICDAKLEEYARGKLSSKIEGVDGELLHLVLRELVRLHEHSHALLHTGDFRGCARLENGLGLDEWYVKLPPKLNEPLVEFIAYSVVQSAGKALFTKVFEEVDKDSPEYYQGVEED